MKPITFSSEMIAVWLVIAMASTSSAAPVGNSTKALAFLSKFGYLTPSEADGNRLAGDEPTSDDLKKAIREYQAFVGLTETGTLDEETVNEMSKPRCGIRDKFLESDSDRFALGGSRWTKSTLTYKISKYSNKLSRNDVNNVIREAFNKWSQVTPLRFVKRSSGPVHIDIKFASGAHGDGEPFDGPGETLAHAAYPLDGGDVHFDDDEDWTMDFSGTSVLQTAIHEIGHALGLDHSGIRKAIMYPTYHPSAELHRDDIRGIRRLYPS